MVGKRVEFDDETWAAINLLRQERHRSFQQLADEAFRDLLEKHQKPVGLKAQLRESLRASGKSARAPAAHSAPKKGRKRASGQTEMLLPISGKKEKEGAQGRATAGRNKVE
ncbi:MAG TPA: hypothetical protein VKV77_13415 [Methylovirgula sp.]|nr:hypothetical protein [Methylovirgula sp.]